MSIVVLVALGAGIFGALGTLHLVYTLFTPKFDPRDATVREAMERTSPRLTRQTTMWKAWVGFNVSHSLGAMVFAAFFLLLAIRHPQLLSDSPTFVVLALVNGLAWLAVACKYWFRIPLTGIALATACFAIAAVEAFR